MQHISGRMYVDCEEDSEDMRERGMKGLGHRDACATQNCISSYIEEARVSSAIQPIAM